MPDNIKSIYFRNLNGIRFIAALFVFTNHVESTQLNFNLPYTPNFNFFTPLGKTGVVMFFVLSGFLITSLLLQEKKNNGIIDIKHFYVKRILRIWPLYFVIILFGFFIAPKIHFFDIPNVFDNAFTNRSPFYIMLLLHIFLLPNFSISVFGNIPYAGQVWSIGVEEQFYLIWPLILSKRINALKSISFILLVFFMIKFTIIFIYHFYPSTLLNNWVVIFSYFNIDCLAIGGIGAYLTFTNKNKILTFIYNKKTQLTTYILLLIMIITGFGHQIKYNLHYDLYAILFCIVFMNLACNKNNMLNLEYEPLKYLGKISYGIYMYHFIALTLAVRLLQRLDIANSYTIYFLGLIFTIIIASFSYHFFESYFLHLKDKISKTKLTSLS